MNNPAIDAILNMAMNNPMLKSNPNAQSMLNVVRSGNAQQGQQIADNLCKSMGMTRDEALRQAKGFFNL